MPLPGASSHQLGEPLVQVALGGSFVKAKCRDMDMDKEKNALFFFALVVFEALKLVK